MKKPNFQIILAIYYNYSDKTGKHTLIKTGVNCEKVWEGQNRKSKRTFNVIFYSFIFIKL